MARYHINPKTGNPGICHAVRKCPFGDIESEHYSTKEEARAVYEKLQSDIAVGYSAHRGVREAQKALEEAVGIPYPELVRPFVDALEADGAASPGFSFLTPSGYRLGLPHGYGEPDYANLWTYDHREVLQLDYGSGYLYEGLRMEKVSPADIYRLATQRLGAELLPRSLKKNLEGEMGHLTNVANWHVYAQDDYYGDIVRVNEPPRLQEMVEEWYYSLPNATDREGILAYVRSLGTDTRNCRPREALIKQLVAEHGGEIHQRVNPRVGLALKQRVNLREISGNSFPGKNAATVRPLPTPKTGNSNVVTGVLTRQGRKYVILDGKKRLAYFLDHNPEQRSFNFFVI